MPRKKRISPSPSRPKKRKTPSKKKARKTPTQTNRRQSARLSCLSTSPSPTSPKGRRARMSKRESEVEKQIKAIEYTEYFIDFTEEQRDFWRQCKGVWEEFLNEPSEDTYNILYSVYSELKYVPDQMKEAISELEGNTVLEGNRLVGLVSSILWVFTTFFDTPFKFTYNGETFTCEDVMAIGGQGIIFNCHSSIGRDCVLKMIAHDPNELKEEIKKLTGLKRIKHVVQPITPMLSHSCSLSSEGMEGVNVFYAVFPRYGPSLSHLMKYENFDFNDEFLKWMVRKVKAVLETIHKREIVHLDIHPGNILLGAYNQCKDMYEPELYLIDFGISESVAECDKRIVGCVGVDRFSSPFLRVRVPSDLDDMLSLMFMSIYLKEGNLPWEGSEWVEKEKKDFLDEEKYREYSFLDSIEFI